MKIFGFDITFKRNKKVPLLELAEVVNISNVTPSTKPISKIPLVSINTLNYATRFNIARGQFIGSDVDLSEVGKILSTESYVRQAFKKKESLMFKEGINIQGKNKQTIQYYKARMAQIAKASGIPTSQLQKRIAISLIQTSNAFLIKARNIKASGGQIRKTVSGKKMQPVAAYFPVAPETMKVNISADTGRPLQWRQMMPDGRYRDFDADDVIHFTLDKQEGFLFGTPSLVPVADDIRALRQIEENIELLLYQHLFPLYHYKVGTETAPAGYTEDGYKEIDLIKEEIELMPSEGAIVTPERHEITAIGAEGRAIRAEGYIDHFKKRVFSGLGVSGVDLGEGESATKACYSEDTQTLTDSGWKYYWEINPEVDKIATFNPKTNLMEFNAPIGGLFLYDHEGEMYRFKSQTVDTLVTSNHDMWVCENHGSSPNKWVKIHADQIWHKNFCFRTACHGQNITEDSCVDFFDLPYIPYKYHTHYPNDKSFTINMNDWLEFLGYFISEGYLGKMKSRYMVNISQNESVNPVKTQKIRECLQRLPFEFKEHKYKKDNSIRWYIHCKSLYSYLINECGIYSYNKKIPKEYFDLNDNQLQILFDALILGDGSKDLRKGRINFAYYSSSEELIDQMQELCVRLGYRSVLMKGTRCKRLSITKKEISSLGQYSITKIPYQGKVYCFNVPNHLFITRRNGRIGIHGNTAFSLSKALVDSVKAIQDEFESQWDEFIITELLLESTFGDNALEEENMVHIQFREIDLRSKIELEQHFLNLWKTHAISHDELRNQLGFEPMVLPDKREDFDLNKYPEWSRTYWKLIEEPSTIFKAVDEPGTADAKQALKTKKEPSLNNPNPGAPPKSPRNRQPRLQKIKNNVLKTDIDLLKQEIITKVQSNIKETNNLGTDYLIAVIRTWMSDSSKQFQSQLVNEYISGFEDESGQSPSIYSFSNSSKKYIKRILDNLSESVISLFRTRIDKTFFNVRLDEAEHLIINEVSIVFDLLNARINSIWRTENRRAYLFGRINALKSLGHSHIQLVADSESCKKCQALNNSTMSTNIKFENSPPYHPNSRIDIKRININEKNN